MFFYIFPYFVVYVYSLYIYITKTDDKIKIADLLIVLFPSLLVAVLRGNIGVDTPVYSRFFTDKANGILVESKFEVGFEIIVDVLIRLGFSNSGIFGFIAIAITFFLSWSFSGNKKSALFLLLVYFPIFYVDSTMNALRYGLSFAIATLALNFMHKRRYFNFIFFALVAISIQISALAIFTSFLVARFNWKIVVSLVLIILFWQSDITDAIIPYLISKKDAYTYSFAPGSFSGIVPLCVFLILYVLALLFTRRSKVVREVHLFLILEIFSFILAKYSYAGLRFQMLFLFCLIMSLNGMLDYVVRPKLFFKTLFAFSLFLFGIFIRNIVYVEPDLESKYLPYEFFWS